MLQTHSLLRVFLKMQRERLWFSNLGYVYLNIIPQKPNILCKVTYAHQISKHFDQISSSHLNFEWYNSPTCSKTHINTCTQVHTATPTHTPHTDTCLRAGQEGRKNAKAVEWESNTRHKFHTLPIMLIS